jgi:hypothetical protein
MKETEYHKELGATAACSIRMAKATANNGQENTKAGEPTVRDRFFGDSWFAGVKVSLLLFFGLYDYYHSSIVLF